MAPSDGLNRVVAQTCHYWFTSRFQFLVPSWSVNNILLLPLSQDIGLEFLGNDQAFGRVDSEDGRVGEPTQPRLSAEFIRALLVSHVAVMGG